MTAPIASQIDGLHTTDTLKCWRLSPYVSYKLSPVGLFVWDELRQRSHVFCKHVDMCAELLNDLQKWMAHDTLLGRAASIVGPSEAENFLVALWQAGVIE